MSLRSFRAGVIPVLLLCSLRVFAANPAVTVNVDASADRHAIDPRIYGSSWASAAEISALGLTLNRWGGNAMSRYNWAFSTANRCKDYYFFNIPDAVSSGDGSNGKSADDFIGMTFGAGAQPVMTIPMLGLLPKDRTKRCSYPQATFPNQEAFSNPAWEPITCGNGRLPDGDGVEGTGPHVVAGADPSGIATVYPASHQGNWVQHLIDTWTPAQGGPVRYYSLDNEPSLWHADHWDVHPQGASYDEVWGKMQEFGALIRAKDPNAILTGPEEWGWSGYFMSGLDQDKYGTAAQDQDRLAHGGTKYIDWLLQQAAGYEAAHGVRILDVLTVHYYPQSGEFFSGDTSPAMQELRNRSTRSLWDPNYVDESWIGGTEAGGAKVRLIPRLKEWAATQYPGTKIGITEYNWGVDSHINGGTTQADILGIFGREGLDLGVRWGTPAVGSYAANAFRMYRNYNGSAGKFGETSVRATGPNPDNVSVFASVRTSDGALTVMLIAKTLSGDTLATVNLAGFVASRVVQRWELKSTNTITQLANLTPSGSAVSLTLPAQSITLLVVPAATAPGAPTIGAATPGNGSASIAFTAPASDGGSNITGYRVTCNPGGVVGTGAASPVTVGGLTNGVTYSCSVQALNAVGAGAASGNVNVTPVAPVTTLTATATSAAQVALTWPVVAGAVNYEVQRSFNNSAFAPLVTTAATSYNDNSVSANTTYLYKVRAVTGGGPGAFSAVDAATTVVFVDAPLTVGIVAKATHWAQLRTAVNAMRASAGLSAQSFTDPALSSAVKIKLVHLTELRTALDQARAAIGLPALTYTAGAGVRAAQVNEIREGVK
jgi:hypothetical protein